MNQNRPIIRASQRRRAFPQFIGSRVGRAPARHRHLAFADGNDRSVVALRAPIASLPVGAMAKPGRYPDGPDACRGSFPRESTGRRSRRRACDDGYRDGRDGNGGPGPEVSPQISLCFRGISGFRRSSFCSWGPSIRPGRRAKTRRATHRMCVVFGRDRMSLPKMPADLADPAQSAGRMAGVCFLWATFLCTSKERWLARQRESFGLKAALANSSGNYSYMPKTCIPLICNKKKWGYLRPRPTFREMWRRPEGGLEPALRSIAVVGLRCQ